jgi:ferric-chelate reductase
MRTITQSIILLSVFVVCTGLTVGLTYAPCYASLCSEEFFPADTRYHIATFYGLIASIAAALLMRAHTQLWHRVSSTYITKREVPIFGKRFSIGGLLLVFWILFITLVTTAFWLNGEVDFWTARVEGLDWDTQRVKLVVTGEWISDLATCKEPANLNSCNAGIIGHHIDVILGLVLVPVGRNSLLVRVFKLSYGTLLYTHKLLAYLLILGSVAHGIAYCLFWSEYDRQPRDSPRHARFDVNNPTLTVAQAKERGPWSQGTLGTGIATALLMLVILFTALPVLRRRSYNTFYYAHVICSIVIFVGTCIHASTNFYFLLPGILLWLYDWYWRAFSGETGLSKEVDATLSPAGGAWYRIVLPALPTSETSPRNAEGDAEKLKPVQPLQTYYLNVPAISRLQNHAFTAAKVAANGDGAVLLFQKTQAGAIKRSAKAQDREWTWKLTDLIDKETSAGQTFKIKVRVEGPSIPVTKGYETSDDVVCVVGGTGLTGAYSIARWWYDHRSRETSSRFTLVWTARQGEAFQLKEWAELLQMCAACDNMDLQAHCSSKDGRLDVQALLKEQFIRSTGLAVDEEAASLQERQAWVYASGPNGLLTAASDACIDLESDLRRARKMSTASAYRVTSLNHYTADWEV